MISWTAIFLRLTIVLSPLLPKVKASLPTGQPTGDPTMLSTRVSELTARFIDDGSAANIFFPDPITIIGSRNFPCLTLFVFTGTAFAQCSWTSSYIVNIKFTPGFPAPIVGDDLVVVGGIYLGLPGTIYPVRLQRPLNPIKPVVVLPKRLTIVPCFSPVLDVLMSTGSGGRNWGSVAITVSSPSSTAPVLQADLMSKVSLVRSMQPITIPAALLESKTFYEITVRLCNFLLACGESTMVLHTESLATPFFSILGTQTRVMPSSSVLDIAVSPASYLTCNGTALRRTEVGITYEWSISRNNVRLSNLRSLSKDRTKFRLLSYSLTSGFSYVVTAHARHVSNPQVAANVSVTVVVLKGDIIARIAGGSSQSIPWNTDFELDGSASYDSDLGIGVNSNLKFSWKCSEVGETLLSSCPSLQINSDLNSFPKKVLMRYTNADTTKKFRFDLTVIDTSASTRSASTFVELSVIPSGSPVVTLTKSLSKARINVQDSLRLTASVTTTVPTTISWSIQDDLLTVGDVLSVSETLSVVAGTYSFSTLPILRALTPEVNYRLTISAGNSFASVDIRVNSPPIVGLFRVSPNPGVEAVDNFVFSAALWTDDDLPIRYEYGFSRSTEENLIFLPLSLAATVSSNLPAGYANRNYVVPCYVNGFDILNAFSSTVTAVTVLPASWSAAASVFTGSLTFADSVSSLKRTISITSAFLNNANCTDAPDCEVLNRNPCGSTVATCGECLDGYYGHAGHQNTPCGDALSFDSGVSVPCDSDEDCGQWKFCDLSNHICLANMKTCSSNCTFNGDCIFMSADDESVLPWCRETDASCVAACRCNEGYTGIVCEINADHNEKLSSLRSLIVTQLNSTISRDDMTYDAVMSFVSMLSAATQDSYSIAADSIDVILSTAESIIVVMDELAIPDKVMKQILNSLESIQIALSHPTMRSITGTTRTAIRGRIASVIDEFGFALTATWLGSGSQISSTILKSFRTTSKLFFATDTVRLESPLSAVERLNGIRPHGVELVSESAGSGSISVVMTELKGKVTSDLPVLSTVMRIVMRSENTSKLFRFTLQNTRPVYFPVTPSNITFETTCLRRVVEEFDFMCPDDGFVIRHRCNGTSLKLRSTCPGRVVLPICRHPSNTTQYNCTVESFTATNTTCVCHMKPSVNTIGRRRLTSDFVEESGSLEIAAMSVESAEDFKGTFYEAQNFNSLNDVKGVLTIIYMYSVMWGFGLLLSWFFSISKSENRAKSFNQALQNTRLNAMAQSTNSMEAIKKYLNTYVDEIFPPIYSPRPWYERMTKEIVAHHRYICIFFGANEPERRFIMTIHLLTVQTMLMFMLAVFYDIQFPEDDGSCDNLSLSVCEDEKSLFDQSKSQCKWDDGNKSCEYVNRELSWQMIIIISIVVAIFTAPVNLIVDFIFDDILSSPTADSLKEDQRKSMMQRAGRRMSNAVRRVSITATSAIRRASVSAGAAVNRFAKTNNNRRTIRFTKTRVIPRDTLSAQGLAAACASTLASKFGEGNTIEMHTNGTQVEQSYDTLLLEINAQRQELRPSEIELYDINWGLNESNALFSNCLGATDKDKDNLKSELKYARRTADTLYERLSSEATDSEIGLELLHTFILDLLGRDTAAAKIFSGKTSNDFRHAYVVSPWMKSVAWIVAIILNVFFVYFSLLRGMQRGGKWQTGYVMACAVQFAIEVVLYQTTECLWMNFVIPDAAKNDIQNIRNDIKRAIDLLCQTNVRDPRYFLDAPSYLFVSTILAKKFPTRLESMIITSYKSHMPGPLAKKWKNRSTKTIISTLRNISVFGLTIAVLEGIGSLPRTVQRVTIHSLQPLVVAALLVFFLFMYTNPVYLTILLLPVVYKLIQYTMLRCLNRDSLLGKIRRRYTTVPHMVSNLTVAPIPPISSNAFSEKKEAVSPLPVKQVSREQYEHDAYQISEDSSDEDDAVVIRAAALAVQPPAAQQSRNHPSLTTAMAENKLKKSDAEVESEESERSESDGSYESGESEGSDGSSRGSSESEN